MTVAELIRLLQQHDQDLRVVVRDLDGAYGDTNRVEPVRIALGLYDSGYLGPHAEDNDDCFTELEHVNAISIV